MYSKISNLVILLGFLGVSVGIPLKTYNPQDFYPSGRIVGGIDAPEGHAPHMVALVVGDVLKSFTCGGSLVSRRTVLTAAHCIEPLVSWITGQLMPSVRGQIGSNLLNSGYDAVKFSGHENHPEWDRWLIMNDIGVLRLEEPLDNTRARPIKLNLKWIGGGEKVTVTGWGLLGNWGILPERLQLLKVYTLSPKECELGVGEAIAELGPSPPVFHSVEICTRHKSGAGQGMCHGDSGSALVDAKGRQVASVSWGWPCALGHPDIHTRISGFEDWLRQALALDGVIEE